MYGRIKRVGPALLIGLGVAAFPGSALAGEAHREGDTVVYNAYAGESNAVEVGQVVSAPLTVDIVIHDPAGVDTEPGCSLVNVTTVKCGVSTLGQIPKVELNLGNGNDTAKPALANPVDTFMDVFGGPGNDTLTASDHGGELNGGDGDDHLLGGASGDELNGYFGADKVEGGDGPDTIDGGPGDDELNGDAGADELHGSGGADILRGGTENDELRGEAGPDQLLGNGGKDKYFGGTEADSINAVDDQNETVDCGSGWFANDKAKINDGDTAIDCETVS
jgi:Ca2+-binding RTX toxin-like protein